MTQKEELISEWGQLTVKETELKAEYDRLGPQTDQRWVLNLEELEQMISIDVKIKEIRQKKIKLQEQIVEL